MNVLPGVLQLRDAAGAFGYALLTLFWQSFFWHESVFAAALGWGRRVDIVGVLSGGAN